MNQFSENRPQVHFPDPGSINWDIEVGEEIKAEFLSSSKYSLETLEVMALAIESDPDDSEARGEIKRILHTLKGDSSLIGLLSIGDLIHKSESLIEWLELNGKSPTQLILTVKDWLSATIHGAPYERGRWMDENVSGFDSVPQPPENFRSLIVDDEPTNRLVLSKMLQQYGESDVATNGKESIELFVRALDRGTPYHVIFMDIMMPEMDGQEALKEIRRIEKKHDISPSGGVKVIMVTAKSDFKTVSSSYQALCDAFIVKPVQMENLINELNKLDMIA